jgi:hypothetical protein
MALTLSAALALLVSCEKDITLEFPQTETQVVVEGYIEQGRPPVVFLSRDISLYADVDSSAVAGYSIKGAVVEISDGTSTYPLTEVSYMGLTAYTSFLLLGSTGKRYTLTIRHAGRTLTAFTTVPQPVKLDSSRFKTRNDTSLYGFVRSHITDPDTLGNYYRFFTRRLGKDDDFVMDFSTVVDDQLINGKSLDFDIYRGESPGSGREEEPGEEEGYYKKGDTIVIKWCSIDRAHYLFWRTLERSRNSAGNPFSSPITVQSNVEGGIGVWGGYAAHYDTVVAK